MTPTTPRHDDMRLDPTLNVTPEGSLVNLPVAVGHMAEDRERKNQLAEEELQGTSSETAYMDIPDTCVKTKPETTTREAPRVIQRLKEVSREEAMHQPDNSLLQWTGEIQIFLLEVLQEHQLKFVKEMSLKYLMCLLLLLQPPQSSLMWS